MYTPCSVAGRVPATEPQLCRNVVEILEVVKIWEEILVVAGSMEGVRMLFIVLVVSLSQLHVVAVVVVIIIILVVVGSLVIVHVFSAT